MAPSAQKTALQPIGKITKVTKRDGRVSEFNASKIASAIWKAAQSIGGTNKKLPEELSQKVYHLLEQKFSGQIPTVEDVQDTVEKVLIEEGHARTAKAYILYRQQRAEIRKEKMQVLEKNTIDEVDKMFDVNALRVLKARYLRKDESGKLIETPKQLFTRVAVHDGIPDLFYDSRVFDREAKQQIHDSEAFSPAEWEEKIAIGNYRLNRYHLEATKRLFDRFNKNKQMKVSWKKFFDMMHKGEFRQYEKNIDELYNIMVTKQFMPNTPAIANFGNPLGMGSACFVIGIEDNLESIMDGLKNTAIVFKAGGGMGYNFSKLRPEGDFVSTTTGAASGPMSFMRLFDTMTEVIKQGGIRRGANMGILNSNHPDILKFVTAKAGNKALRNFNISVMLMPDFWDYYKKGTPYPLKNPRNGQVVDSVDPKYLWERVIYQAWESAEPGVLFWDTINKYNPFFKYLGAIETTNPCVAAETLIPTENGLERIDSVRAENIAIDRRTIEINNGNLSALQLGCELVKPLRKIKTGIKECFKVTTNSGYELVATPDHRILTPDGWKEISALEAGSEILIQSGSGKFSSNKQIPIEFENEIIGKNGRKYKLGLPSEWSRELGLLMGWIIGDGFINMKNSNLGLVFSKEDEEARKIIQPIFEKYCNRKIKITEYPNGCVQLRSGSKPIIEFFHKLGINESKEFPNALYTATEEAVLGFLQGLFSSDGTVGMGTKSRNYIRLNSSSEKLLKGVQLLLLNLGIRSSIYDRHTKPKLFFYKDKNGKLKEYQTSGINFELNISKQNLEKFVKKIEFLQSRNADKYDLLKEFEYYQEQFTDAIKSIVPVGKKEVWDITEPKSHSFIAGGMVVHNCGEVLLYPNEPCNLGSINVYAFAREDENGTAYMDWEGLKQAVITCTKFLDNVIDINKFPLKAIEDMSLATRKIGLGVMGVGDVMFELGISYNTEEGFKFMEQLMEFVNYWSKVESIQLAKERGIMPYYNKSFYQDGEMPFAGFYDKESQHFDWAKLAEEVKKHGIRNGYTTIIAPTGSISMIAGVSSGMEPVFSSVYQKHVAVGSFYYVDPAFERGMKKAGLYDTKLLEDVSNSRGSLQTLQYIPNDLKKIFVVAYDMTPEQHIRSLAAFQKWTDSSISKTTNFPADSTVEQMKAVYELAHQLGCKGVTVFRDSSIKSQVLVAGTDKGKAAEQEVKAEIAKAEGTAHKPASSKETCPECKAAMVLSEGCATCPSCGYSYCSAA